MPNKDVEIDYDDDNDDDDGDDDDDDENVAVKQRGKILPRSTKREQRGLYVVFRFYDIIIIIILLT